MPNKVSNRKSIKNQFHSGYLVPSHLPSGKFGYKKSGITNLTQRLYGFSSLPIEFWPRLISRFVNFSCGETSIWDGVDIDARKEGLKVTLNDGTRLIVQSRSNSHMNSVSQHKNTIFLTSHTIQKQTSVVNLILSADFKN